MTHEKYSEEQQVLNASQINGIWGPCDLAHNFFTWEQLCDSVCRQAELHSRFSTVMPERREMINRSLGRKP